MEGTLSPADVAVLSGNRGNSGFGDNNGWWLLIILFALWGGNGNGFFGNGSQGAADNYVLASDFATLQRQIDSATTSLENKGDRIQEQICNSDQMNSQLFATVNANLMNGFANTNLGISNNRYETQLAVSGLGTQLQSTLNNMNYNNAMSVNGITTAINNGFCATNYNNATNTRDIIDNANANFRALHDEIVANRMEDKNQEIAQLRTMLNNATLQASQNAQTNELIQTLRPCPVPSYQTCNPWSGCGCNGTGTFL